VIRAALALAVVAACGPSNSKPTTTANGKPASQPDLQVTHLRVMIEMLYDNECPAAHHFVVYVDGAERGVVEPPCDPKPQPGPDGRVIVTESGIKTAEVPAFDVPPGKHRVSARDTVTGWLAAEKELTFPEHEARKPQWGDIPDDRLPKHEVLPIRFGSEENGKPQHYVRDLVYDYITM